jgi:hypothetical protein
MRPRTVWLVWAFPVFVLSRHVGAGEIGFVEDFALARDRAAALRQLIPGTEDYYPGMVVAH